MGYERFSPVERVIDVCGERYAFWQPPDLDALIDVEAFERDERIPYWANVWESALVLAEEIAGLERTIMDKMSAAELAEVPLKDALKNSVLMAG